MSNMTPEGIRSLVALGESQTVEFKTRLPNSRILGRVLASFANAKGGILLLGVGENSEIVGISNDEVGVALERLQRVSASLLPWSIETGVVDIHGKNVVYAVVDKAPKYLSPVMTSRGEIYMRRGTQDVHGINELSKIVLSLEQLSTRKKDMVVFIAMSFREEEEPALVDYFQAMERAVKATELPIKLNRVDLVEGDYEISQHIMDEIDKADIVIADFTLNSRNVYFELGYARGTKRRIIQTVRKGTDLEFDIRNWRTLFYRNATELEEKLIPELKAAYSQVLNNTAS